MKRLVVVVLASLLGACSSGVEQPPENTEANKPAAGQSEADSSQAEAQPPVENPANAEPLAGGESESTPPSSGAEADDLSPYVLSHTMNRIDGTPESLEDYKGKVVLIVNTASLCGLTPQYEHLQTLYDAYKDQGFVVLGFPANQFNDQEPGTNSEITQFCTQNFGVTFPMFEKTVVKGDGTCPLYQQLNALTAEPSWNFTKYLVDREGNLVDRIDPRTAPTDPQLVARIESLLHG